MTETVDSTFGADRHEHTRRGLYDELANEVIRDAFNCLRLAEGFVERNVTRIRALDPHPKSRPRKAALFGNELDAIMGQIHRDAAWFGSKNYAMWTHFVDLDPEMMEREYIRRAEVLIERVAELRAG